LEEEVDDVMRAHQQWVRLEEEVDDVMRAHQQWVRFEEEVDDVMLAHQQWVRFEEEVDDVMPLAFAPKVLTVLQAETLTGSWAGKVTPSEQAEEQEKDSNLKLIKDWLRDKVTPTLEELARHDPEVKILWARRDLLDLRNDVLCYTWEGTTDKHLYVVPKHQRPQMLDLAHNNVTAGHLGIDKTKARLREVCFWTSQSSDVRTHVISCHACASNKHLRRKFRAPLSTLSMGAPMERVHLDILGPLPTSRKGDSYVLLMVDQFTKWVEAVPLPDQTAESIARAAVDCFFTRLGCPVEICTDQGSNFMSELFRSLCARLEIGQTRTTPYHPAANGQVERMNHTILHMIRCTLEGGQHNWDEKLPLLMAAIRSTPNRSTGFTPNRLMLGRWIIMD
jgi:transposase InsO family protein